MEKKVTIKGQGMHGKHKGVQDTIVCENDRNMSNETIRKARHTGT